MANGDGTVSIELTKGQWATIDEEDLHLVLPFSWFAKTRSDGNGFYAAATGGRLMHRVIIGANPGEFCDHRDGNGIMNRRYNLRLATKAQNSWNSVKRTGRYGRGVKFVSGKYYARIITEGKHISLGGYDTAEEAQQAYLSAEKVMHGDFAVSRPLDLP